MNNFLNFGDGLMLNIASIVAVEAFDIRNEFVRVTVHYGAHGDAKTDFPIEDKQIIMTNPLEYLLKKYSTYEVW